MQNDWIINKSDLVLITGANGFIGSKVVEILLEYGFTRLRCLVRSSKNLSNLQRLTDSSKQRLNFFKGICFPVMTACMPLKGCPLFTIWPLVLKSHFPAVF